MIRPILGIAAATIAVCGVSRQAAAQTGRAMQSVHITAGAAVPSERLLAVQGRARMINVQPRARRNFNGPGALWARLDGETQQVPDRAYVWGSSVAMANFGDILYAFGGPAGSGVVHLSIVSPADGTYFMVQCDVHPGSYSVLEMHVEGAGPANTVTAGNDDAMTFVLDNVSAGVHAINIYRNDASPWAFRGCDVRKL